ncbi:hypothetical protein EXN66_Car010365 [Channa argus]|uniref:Uncharacterized protein n=1 Tax=Channa argus TaxID=215402 RepID=A0A6G1PWT2_CHAAH|nr:hypothetical protein EXN66_Car010365 [Channa argus]
MKWFILHPNQRFSLTTNLNVTRSQDMSTQKSKKWPFCLELNVDFSISLPNTQTHTYTHDRQRSPSLSLLPGGISGPVWE